MTWFSEKMLISTRCICGFMPKLHKKSWMVSNNHPWLSWWFLRLVLISKMTWLSIMISFQTSFYLSFYWGVFTVKQWWNDLNYQLKSFKAASLRQKLVSNSETWNLGLQFVIFLFLSAVEAEILRLKRNWNHCKFNKLDRVREFN